MPESHQEVGVLFPTAGLDVTCEFGRQPADTAAAGVNVRTSDPIAGRERGGSRPGLSKRINHVVYAADAEVQHVAVLVDPQSAALSANYDTPNPIFDPSTNNLSNRNPSGRTVPDGGGGVQLNRNVPDPEEGSNPLIRFVSGYRIQLGSVTGGVEHEVTLPATPTNQNTLLVIIRTEVSSLIAVTGAATEVLVTACTNGGLNDYTQVGGNGYTSSVRNQTAGGAIDNVTSLSAFWKQANAGATDATVRVTISDTAILEVIVLEYSGCSTTSPVSNQDKQSAEPGGPSWPIEQIPANGTTGQMLVAAWTKLTVSSTTLGPITEELSDGWTPRFGGSSAGGSFASTDTANAYVADRGSVSGSTPLDVSVGFESQTGGTVSSAGYAGIAIALTR